MTNTVEREVIAKFIDAAVNDHDSAQQLLDAYPDLRHATWLGEEHVLNFMVIENLLCGVSFCLEHDFDPNQRDGDPGTSPLHLACKLNYFDVARILLQYGADPNAVSEIDDTPLHCSIANGNASLVDMLIESGADPTYTTDLGETMLDNWPPWAESELAAVLAKHNIKPRQGGMSDR